MHTNIKTLYSAFLLCIILISCGTTDKASDPEGFSAETGTDNSEIITDTEDHRKSGFPEAVWNMSGKDGCLYFTGISPYYLDEKKSDEVLLNDASRSAAVFDNVFGFSEKITGKSSAGVKTGSSFNYIFDNSSYKYYMENLEEEATYRENDSVYRIYSVKNSFKLPLIKEAEIGRTPGWISRLPEIEGYLFSIGVSGRYSRIADSVGKADSSALEAMIKQKNITVYSDSGYNNLNPKSYEYASSGLKGFYILRRWWSEDMKNFYSLGVIRENN